MTGDDDMGPDRGRAISKAHQKSKTGLILK